MSLLLDKSTSILVVLMYEDFDEGQIWTPYNVGFGAERDGKAAYDKRYLQDAIAFAQVCKQADSGVAEGRYDIFRARGRRGIQVKKRAKKYNAFGNY